MDDAVVVQDVERVRDLQQQRKRVGRGERPVHAQVVLEALAVEQLHREARDHRVLGQRRAGGDGMLDQVEDPAEALVRDVARHEHLAAEPLGGLGVADQLRPEGLEGDAEAQPLVERFVDLAGGAARDRAH